MGVLLRLTNIVVVLVKMNNVRLGSQSQEILQKSTWSLIPMEIQLILKLQRDKCTIFRRQQNSENALLVAIILLKIKDMMVNNLDPKSAANFF